MLDVTHLSKTYGDGDRAVQAVGDLTFHVERGEFVCIVGPSGCGKTTLLKCVAGLISPTSGTVTLADKQITGPPKEVAVVFQEYSRSLLPWLTVRGNVELVLRNKGLKRNQRHHLIDDNLAAVGLSSFDDHYPWQLSGGMQQRVAIARALAYQSEILLMDEPFASVDAQTRADLEDLILRVRDEFDITIVFVTHDIDESVYLSDRVIVLSTPPTTVSEDITINLPKPRDQVATKELPEFAHLRTHVFQLIKRDEATTADEPKSQSKSQPVQATP